MYKIFMFFLLCLLGFPSNAQLLENYVEEVNGISIQMVAVPGGVFEMGNPDSDPSYHPEEGPVHEVEVDSFWLASYEVTWDLYEAFLNKKAEEKYKLDAANLGIEVDGITGASIPYIDMSAGMGKEDHPVTNITQHAALSFCKWLSAKTGRFYRLPTEAEWEYACKKGRDKKKESTIETIAWTKENSPDKYQKVGAKTPNSLGIYDMLGNVAEWTMDQYDVDFYAKSTIKNPWAVPDELYPRTLRGGSWKDRPQKCTCTSRKKSRSKWKRIDPQLPKSRWWYTNAPFVGFRILKPYKTPSPEEIKQYWLAPIDDF